MSFKKNNLQLVAIKPQTVSSIIRPKLAFSSLIALLPVMFHSTAVAEISCLQNHYQSSADGHMIDEFCDQFNSDKNTNYQLNFDESDTLSAEKPVNSNIPPTIPTRSVAITDVINAPNTQNVPVIQQTIHDNSESYKVKLTTENLEVLKTFYQGSSIDYDIYLVSNDIDTSKKDTLQPSYLQENTTNSSSDLINLQTLTEFYATADNDVPLMSEKVITKNKNHIPSQTLQVNSKEKNQLSTPTDSDIKTRSKDDFFTLNRLKSFYNNFDFFGLKKKS